MMSYRNYKIGVIALLSVSSCSYSLSSNDVRDYLLCTDFFDGTYEKIMDIETENNTIIKENIRLLDDYYVYIFNSSFNIGNRQISIYFNEDYQYSFDNVVFYNCHAKITRSNFAYDDIKDKIYFYDGMTIYEYKDTELDEIINNPFSKEVDDRYSGGRVYLKSSGSYLEIYEDGGYNTLGPLDYCKISCSSESKSEILEIKKYNSEYPFNVGLAYFSQGGTSTYNLYNNSEYNEHIVLEDSVWKINEENMTLDYENKYSMMDGTIFTFIKADDKSYSMRLKNDLFDIDLLRNTNEKFNMPFIDVFSFITNQNIYLSLNYTTSKKSLYFSTNRPRYSINYTLKINRESGKISYFRPDSLSYFHNLIFENNNFYFEIYGASKGSETYDSDTEYITNDIYKIKLD